MQLTTPQCNTLHQNPRAIETRYVLNDCFSKMQIDLSASSRVANMADFVSAIILHSSIGIARVRRLGERACESCGGQVVAE